MRRRFLVKIDIELFRRVVREVLGSETDLVILIEVIFCDWAFTLILLLRWLIVTLNCIKVCLFILLRGYQLRSCVTYYLHEIVFGYLANIAR